MNAPAEKVALRARLRALRASVRAPERALLSQGTALRALELPQVAGALNVLAFVATPEELDPAPLLDALRERGAVVTLPRIAGPGHLTIHTHDGDIDLEEGPFGLRQPTADHPVANAERIDLVVVPGVAFDATGGRLGFGGGYYDRLLGLLPHAYRLALAYDFQIVGSVPVHEHDQAVDAIVTPTSTLVSPHAP